MLYYRIPKTGDGSWSNPVRPSVAAQGSSIDLGSDMLVAVTAPLPAPAVEQTIQQVLFCIQEVNPEADLSCLGVQAG